MKEYIFYTDMVYVNNSDYDIEVQHLNSDHFELREKISIPKHTEVIVYKTSADTGYSLLEANTALVTYDHTVRITHRWNNTGEIPNSLRVLDSYAMTENSKKRYRRYTYTFTNADYEYAVAHNEMGAAEVAE